MYFLAPLTAFTITCATLLALVSLAPRFGLLDTPGGRKGHESATPMVGGIGIFLGLLVAMTLVPELLVEFAPLLTLSALVLLVGVIDDSRELSATMRMAAHGLIALSMAVVADVRIYSLGNLADDAEVLLGVLAIPLTVFATVGVINAINMSDGVDGLSGGIVLITLGLIGTASIIGGDNTTAMLTALLICALFAFLTLNYRHPWNRRAIVYMGDAGSTTLGFLLAWLLIDSSQGDQAIFPPVIALWFLAIPLFDTVNLLIRRPLAGRSCFSPGSDHLHHSLLKLGLSVEAVVGLLLCLTLLFGVIGLAGWYFRVSEALMFGMFLLLFSLYFLISPRLTLQSRAAVD